MEILLAITSQPWGMMNSDLFMAFLTGILGSAHCIGMCGGFVMLYSAHSASPRQSRLNHLLYSGARVASYVLVGLLMGTVGSFADAAGTMAGIHRFMLLAASGYMVVAAGVMLVLGKELSGGGSWFGARLNTIIGPLLHRSGAWSALVLGATAGLLPCGLVYMIAAKAAGTGTPMAGGAVMFFFGLGTVPAMLGLGTFSNYLTTRFRSAVYKGAALVVLIMGVHGLWRWGTLLCCISPGLRW